MFESPTTQEREALLACARGEQPVDLLLENCRVLAVHTGEWLDGPVAIVGGRVLGVGTTYDTRQRVDVGGRHLVPGFVDAHVHIESSKLTPRRFAEAVVPRGTTAVVAEPHEIGNVLGVEGVRWFVDAADGVPLDVYGMVPSCVPASAFEHAGARIDADDIAALLEHPRMLGIGEMMNFPGVIAGEASQLAMLAAPGASHVDGHAPGVRGADLDAYTSVGIGSDHESTTVEEALDKRRRGMWVLMREASNARNLRSLIPLVKQYGPDNMALCTDDREPDELVSVGHIDELIRICISEGVMPEVAYRLGSLHPARAHGLTAHGSITPGSWANLVALDDVHEVRIHSVWHRGLLAAERGQLQPTRPAAVPSWVTDTMHQAPVNASDFAARISQHPSRSTVPVRVIGIEPAQLITHSLVDDVTPMGSEVFADPAADRAKLAVIDRHTSTGRVGVGFVRGFAMNRGALASTVAHDAHNTVVAGVSDDDMALAANHLADIGGGIVVVADGEIVEELALPIAGLVSDEPAIEVAAQMDRMNHAARTIGITLDAPFMVLSFLALSVIPHLKLTDRGYVDVDAFQLVDMVVHQEEEASVAH